MDAGELTPPEWVTCGDAPYAGGTVLRAGYRLGIPLPREAVWPHLAGVGGRRGWYYQTWLWRLRGTLDKLVGGVGLGRGRRSAGDLRVGEALDFWAGAGRGASPSAITFGPDEAARPGHLGDYP